MLLYAVDRGKLYILVIIIVSELRKETLYRTSISRQFVPYILK